MNDLEREALRAEIEAWEDVYQHACPENKSIEDAKRELLDTLYEEVFDKDKRLWRIYDELDAVIAVKNTEECRFAYLLGRYNNNLDKALEVYNQLFGDYEFGDRYKELIGDNIVELKPVN